MLGAFRDRKTTRDEFLALVTGHLSAKLSQFLAYGSKHNLGRYAISDARQPINVSFCDIYCVLNVY